MFSQHSTNVLRYFVLVPSEMPIIIREHFNRWYSLPSYYLAITLADIPIQVSNSYMLHDKELIFFLFQIIATFIYALTTYFMTAQPFEPLRIFLFLFMCILISLVAQSLGLLVGAFMDLKVR